MADYFRHWLAMGKRMAKRPRVFHVNWFRTDRHGKFIWPGYRENLRILEWVFDRCNGTVGAERSPIGYLPRATDIDMTGIKIQPHEMSELFKIDRCSWQEELKDIRKFFKRFGRSLPSELWDEYRSILKRLKLKDAR